MIQNISTRLRRNPFMSRVLKRIMYRARMWTMKDLALLFFGGCLLVASFIFVFSGHTPLPPPTPSRPPPVRPPRPLINVVGNPASVAEHKEGPRRICIVTMEIGFSSPGGIGTAYTGLALKLVEKGHNVTILFVDDNRHTRSEWMTILAPLEELGLHLHYIEPMALTGCYYSCQRSYRIYQWLKAYEGDFDVVHFHDNGGPGFYATRAKAQGLAFKDTVLCIGAHGPHMWVLEWNRETVDSLVHLEVDEMERSSVAQSDVMISPSSYMPMWMTGNGWTLPEQSYVHPNILPTSIDTPIIPILSASKVSIKELVFFGRLERRKGLWIFLEALELIWNNNNKAFENTVITFLGKDTLFRDPTKKNKETRASQEVEIFCNTKKLNCIFLLNMDHVGAIQYLQYPGIVAIMPSPMDNSPNVVSECLMYGIPFVAFSVGGIPELIHHEDRPFVLSAPDADSLADKLTTVIAEGAYRARIAMDTEIRASVWLDWHQNARSQERNLAVKSPSAPRPSVSICVLYNPTKWGNNLEQVIKSLKAHKSHRGADWEILVLEKYVQNSDDAWAGMAQKLAAPIKLRVTKHRLDEADIVQLYSHAITNSKSDYVLLLDPVSWLSGSTSLDVLQDVMLRTRADIVTAQAYLNDSTNSILLHLGSVGLYSSIVNCIGDWNMLAKRSAMETVLPFDRGDDIWRVYARAMMKGYKIESIPEPLFYQSVRISRDVDHRNVLEVNREFRPLFIRPYDTLVMVTQGFIKTKRMHDIEEESLRNEFEALTQQLEQYKKSYQQKQVTTNKFLGVGPSLSHVKFLFVRGFEKSGTSWLRDIIKLHPGVYIAHWEFHMEIMTRAVQQFTSKPWQSFYEPYNNITHQWFNEFVPSLLASGVPESIHHTVKWIGEKTPGALEPILPGGKYIYIIRDGRDVVISLFFHFAKLGGFEGFCAAHGYLVPLDDVKIYRGDDQYFDKNPEKLLVLEACVKQVAKMWRERIKSDQATADKINAEFPNSVMRVRYEDMLDNCDPEREKIYKWLGLNPEDASPLSRVGWTMPGFGGEKQSQRNPFYRKGISGDYKNFMIGESKRWFKEEAGDVLIELGYEKDNDW